MCANRIITKEEMTTAPKLARNLRALREETGYSQAAIANKIHKTQLTIHKYESGKTEPKASTLRQLLDIYESELGRHITLDEVISK